MHSKSVDKIRFRIYKISMGARFSQQTLAKDMKVFIEISTAISQKVVVKEIQAKIGFLIKDVNFEGVK